MCHHSGFAGRRVFKENLLDEPSLAETTHVSQPSHISGELSTALLSLISGVDSRLRGKDLFCNAVSKAVIPAKPLLAQTGADACR